jgi:hypothetical protein
MTTATTTEPMTGQTSSRRATTQPTNTPTTQTSPNAANRLRTTMAAFWSYPWLSLRAMFMVMAGGGVKGAQVIRASDAKGTEPAGEAIRPDDVAASLYRCLGIDPRKEYRTATGRPVMIVRDGRPIEGLFV